MLHFLSCDSAFFWIKTSALLPCWPEIFLSWYLFLINCLLIPLMPKFEGILLLWTINASFVDENPLVQLRVTIHRTSPLLNYSIHVELCYVHSTDFSSCPFLSSFHWAFFWYRKSSIFHLCQIHFLLVSLPWFLGYFPLITFFQMPPKRLTCGKIANLVQFLISIYKLIYLANYYQQS